MNRPWSLVRVWPLSLTSVRSQVVRHHTFNMDIRKFKSSRTDHLKIYLLQGDDIMNNDIVGTQIGIYDVLYECDFKANDGHKMYHVRCSECGWETDKRKIDIERVKTCTHRNKLSQEQLNQWYENNKKQCLFCGSDMPLGSLGFNEYKEKEFCSHSCAALYNNKKIKLKPKNKCKNCGKELSNRVKIYCDIHCQWEYKTKQYIQKWKNGEVSGTIGNAWINVSNYIRRYLFEKYDYRCARCGWSEINPYTGTLPLEVEHIDGDATNNSEENLTLLCPNCHSLTRTYRGANKGNGNRDIKWLSRGGKTTNLE